MVSESTANYSLLITDDDQSFRETLQEILEPEGFRTVLASCGEEALDIAASQSLHLAILDHHMPQLTGLDTLRILRTRDVFLPVILITGDRTQRLVREAVSAQAFCVISKPVDRHMVVGTVRQAIRHYYDVSNLPGESHETGSAW